MNPWDKPTKLKIILLGDSGVGKTSLVKRYDDRDFKEQHLSTVSIDFLHKDLCIENKPVSLQVWDTAGQERFQSLTSEFYRKTNGCVLVYDVNRLETFKSLDNWHAKFIEVANPNTPEKFPFVLMGNKMDVKGVDGVTPKRVVNKEKAVEWCKSKGWAMPIPYFETSAKEKINVDEAFLDIVHKALSHVLSHINPYPTPSPIDIIEPVEVQARSCAC